MHLVLALSWRIFWALMTKPSPTFLLCLLEGIGLCAFKELWQIQPGHNPSCETPVPVLYKMGLA